MDNIKNRCYELLKSIYGKDAEFRDGQLEAIEATVFGKRTLVVQKTGWGKSLVYFFTTKILREKEKGITFVVSPLLVLMNNQLDAAQKMGLKCEMLNSETRERWGEIIANINLNNVDLIFVTPESLFNKDFYPHIAGFNIGMFVIDEAHCISDWGHDFRLTYGRLNRIIKILPQNVPILATTATANNRVVNDVKKQLGDNLYISRGKLDRQSLYITVMNMNSSSERYAFILKTIKKLAGNGIIYCSTKRDCEYLAEYLKRNGVDAVSYYSGKDGEDNNQAEKDFYENKIKVLVATVKMGMGYDKPDIAFVIHFQLPQNPVAYYQQIGRAGRNITKAHCILLQGAEDEGIIDSFIEDAFPKKQETEAILNELIKSNTGLSRDELKRMIDISHGRMEKALYFLENDGAISKSKSKYMITLNKYLYDEDKYKSLMAVKHEEKNQLKQLLKTKECYSKFIRNCLDDINEDCCGKCSNCDSDYKFEMPNIDEVESANRYINGKTLIIEPKKKFMHTGKLIPKEMQNQEGITLAKYGDSGYGRMVKNDKYSKQNFCDALVNRASEVLYPIIKKNQIQILTAVPSLRSERVKIFATKLAIKCGIQYMDLLQKLDAPQQKTLQNSEHQCKNAFSSFVSKDNVPQKVILVDDIIDSGYTLAACGFKLAENGCQFIYPFALADSKHGDDDE